MFKVLIIRSLLILFSLIFNQFRVLFAQYEGVSTQELKIAALGEFNKGNYSSALNKYEILIKRYPKDGLFHYYSGRCLLSMNRTIPEALKFLEFAITRPNIPSDVYYYLGEAYMQNYQFPQAKKAYTQFIDDASKTELKELNPARKAEIAGNAILITKYYNHVEVVSSSQFNFQDSTSIRQIGISGFSLGHKPAELKSSSEKKDFLSNLCFITADPVKGDYLYFSGYGKSSRKGADLFRVKLLGKKKYSDPEFLETASSEYDEILPYFDPIGKDLYFASEGFSCMGGFDIFKSHFDEGKNTWSEPINLGFPVNSPSNEYIFLPGKDLGSVLLITDRQGYDSIITLYVLNISEPKKSASDQDNEELKKTGKFGAIEPVPDKIKVAEKVIHDEDSPDKKPEIKSVESKQFIPKDFQSSPEYAANLKIALNYQFKSDSLHQIAKEARMKVREVPDPNERWKVQSKIVSWEKQSTDYQSKADEYYSIVRTMEKGKAVTNDIPAVIIKDTTINDLTIYKFTATPDIPGNKNEKPDSLLVAEKAISVKKTLPDVKSTPGKNEGIVQFDILERSPYSAKNPFPVNIKIPPGAFYRIQLGVFSKKVEWDVFGGLTPITAETIPGKPLMRFYVGHFTNFENAKTAHTIVKSKGFKESFITAWYNGQKLAPEKVRDFERRDRK